MGVPSVAIVDTGTPVIMLPNKTYSVLHQYFQSGAAGPVSLHILLEPEVEGGAKLDLKITQDIFGATFAPGPSSGQGTIIGLPLWAWYQHVHFDIGKQSFAFVPRQNPDQFVAPLLEAVFEACCGKK